ncbi:MAG TPA: RNA methyltransferase [Gemmatimonadaceae bacterium]|nr:RNA methyltransferase [Gemmatimonadaceae bacterium]
MRLLTLARDLRRRKARERRGLFVAEGVRAVEELVRSRLEIEGILVAPQLDGAPRGTALLAAARARGLTIETVEASEFASAAETESPQGVLGLARIPGTTLDDLPASETLLLLILDAVQDPGNVGTLVRTALALGATATVALPGTVDLWNAKVVRSAMGSHFHHPVIHSTWDELLAFRKSRDLRLWGADAGGSPVGSEPIPGRLGLVVGNEGAGLTESVRSALDRLVSIPMSPAAESLNVAVAAGILLHEVRA